MTGELVLERMAAFFADRQPEAVMAEFATLSPRTLLQESLDVVDFVVYLEEELGVEIPLQKLGEALYNKNFGELAAEVARLASES